MRRPQGLLLEIGGTLLREDARDLVAGVRALEHLRIESWSELACCLPAV